MKNNQPWTDQLIVNTPTAAPSTSWWTEKAAQVDRTAFHQLQQQRQSAMSAARDLVGPKIPI
jgi:hypothetical protein